MNNFNKITLSERPHLKSKVLSLIEKSFNYSPQNSYEIDFYPLMNEKNLHNCHLIIDESENVIGHVGARVVHFKINEHLFPFTFLGGIAIREEDQGKGLLNELLGTVINEYQSQSTFLLLWSNLSGLYEKFSFYEVGNISQEGNKDVTPIDFPVGFDPISWDSLSETQFLELEQLYNQNANSFLLANRSLEDWKILSKISSSQLFVKQSDQNRIQEYFIANKGADLQGIIHEFGTRDLDNFRAKIFPYKNWMPTLKPTTGNESINLYNFFVRVGVRHLMRFFFKELSQNQLDVLNIQDEQILISLNKKQYGLTQESFLKAFFGPTIIDEFKPFVKPVLISGLDSI